MKAKPTMLILFLVFIFGCKTENQKGVIKVNETEAVALLDTLQLKLNHGKKWIVNLETQGGVVKMDAIIQKFKAENSKDYNGLGKKLSTQVGYIIKNCSMVGESHDQLHVVLVPMLDVISNLKEAKNITEGAVYLEKLEALINDFFLYFKI
ncbi:hypothetical protein Q4512_09135 [Oceanihabitans sp. 2_MG-2023]|uniref:hypothetical protein n=1 Tax=Oceanihabitans sp. 2_MG-2023 TaxID=3062661 RepID=UPI0026E3B18E|nr:hypothetical protein [Oceanihabitans sp. 2_MG-2023]MDO6597079.1 hypothetical protein [Oceanihabitans sp. 2_MG-2023]